MKYVRFYAGHPRPGPVCGGECTTNDPRGPYDGGGASATEYRRILLVARAAGWGGEAPGERDASRRVRPGVGTLWCWRVEPPWSAPRLACELECASHAWIHTTTVRCVAVVYGVSSDLKKNSAVISSRVVVPYGMSGVVGIVRIDHNSKNIVDIGAVSILSTKKKVSFG